MFTRRMLVLIISVCRRQGDLTSAHYTTATATDTVNIAAIVVGFHQPRR
jgi:hypothetical protein